MEVIGLPIEAIRPAAWNANQLTVELQVKLRRSVEKFGVVVPLVVREVAPD